MTVDSRHRKKPQIFREFTLFPFTWLASFQQWITLTSLVKSDNFRSQNTVNTVSEMFQWRTADRVTHLSPHRNEEMGENRCQSRYFII